MSGERPVAWFENQRRLPWADRRDGNNKAWGAHHPVSAWSDKNAAWKEISLEVRDLIAELRQKPG